MLSTKKALLAIPIALISLEIYFGVLLGYIMVKFMAAQKTGEKNRWDIKSLVFSVGEWKIHLHHWFYSLGILASIIFANFSPPFPQFSAGILGGFIIQGITSYSDWYKILKRGK
ncbi:MAG: hypothetical protein Q7S70_02920 [bacterium]|nr:hypothetical protein [bacterium]